MEQGVHVARGVVPEGRDHHLLIACTDDPSCPGVAHAGLGDVPLDPREGARDSPVVGLYHARIASHECEKGNGFRGREGEVASGPVMDAAVLAPAPEPASRAVGHLSFQHRAEDVRVDRAREAEFLGALSRPGARLLMRRVVLRIVAVPLVIGRPLRRGGDGADRCDHLIIPEMVLIRLPLRLLAPGRLVTAYLPKREGRSAFGACSTLIAWIRFLIPGIRPRFPAQRPPRLPPRGGEHRLSGRSSRPPLAF